MCTSFFYWEDHIEGVQCFTICTPPHGVRARGVRTHTHCVGTLGCSTPTKGVRVRGVHIVLRKYL